MSEISHEAGRLTSTKIEQLGLIDFSHASKSDMTPSSFSRMAFWGNLLTFQLCLHGQCEFGIAASRAKAAVLQQAEH